MQNTFSCISLQLFCTTTTGFFQKLPSYTFYGENIVCVPVHFFFVATHLHLGGLQLFSFSHRRHKIFMIPFQRNWSPLFFLSLALPLSLLSTSKQTLKLSHVKERIGFVVRLFLSLKVRVAMRFTLETGGYLKCKISPRLT